MKGRRCRVLFLGMLHKGSLHLASGALVFWETADALGHHLEKKGTKERENALTLLQCLLLAS